MPRKMRTIHKTINDACDEIIEAGNFTDTGTEVALCLLVNAALSYLEHSAITLEDVARNDYDDVDLPTLLGWIKDGPPREDDDDLLAVADAVGVNRTEHSSAERVTSGESGPLSTEPVTTGDAATDVPTTLSLVPPMHTTLPPVIDAKGTPHPERKHYPKCGVWSGLDCTCAQIAPKKHKGGGSRG